MKKLLLFLAIAFYLQTKAQAPVVNIVTPAAGDTNYIYCIGKSYIFSSNPPVLYGYNWSTNPTNTINAGPIQQPHITFTSAGTYTINLQYYTSYSGSGGTVHAILHVDSLGACNTTTAINKTDQNSQLNIYPNPAQNIITIETSNTNKQTINLFDTNGKVVLSQTLNGTTNIDISNLSQGVYNISITSANNTVNKRLVIVK